MPEHNVHKGPHHLSWRCGLAALGLWALAVQQAALLSPAAAQTAAASLEFAIPTNVFATEAGEAPFDIKLKPGAQSTQDIWLEIVTRPTGLSFSAGRSIEGVWRIPVAEAQGLRVKVPAGVFGDGFIYVMLVDKGAIVRVATADVFISPRAGAAPAKPQASLPEPAATATGNPAAAVVAKPAKSPAVAAVTNDKTAAAVERPAQVAVGSTAAPSAPQIASTPPAVPALPSAPPTPPVAVPVLPSPAVPASPAAQDGAPSPKPIAAAPVVSPPSTARPASAPVLPATVTPSLPATTSSPAPTPAAPVEAARAPSPQQATASATSKAPSTAALVPTVQEQAAIVAASPTSPAPQAQRLIAQGERNLADGNISVARQYFAAAAELGSAVGAFKLAETNDPHELHKVQVVGLKADTAEAIRWYRKAAESGMPEAAARVQRLQAR